MAWVVPLPLPVGLVRNGEWEAASCAVTQGCGGVAGDAPLFPRELTASSRPRGQLLAWRVRGMKNAPERRRKEGLAPASYIKQSS
jgi:hypothetical protein